MSGCRPLVIGTLLWACAAGFAASPPPTDSRQQRPVTIAATTQPLAATLAELSQQTSVDLAADEEPLARHRLVLVAKERPLGEVRAQIARFVGVPPGGSYWTRRGTGDTTTYRLMESRASKEARAKLLRDRSARTTTRVREALELARLDDAALDAQRDRNPRLATGRNNYQLAYSLLQSLTPEQLGAALQTNRLLLPFSSLTPPQQQLVRGALARVRMSDVRENPDGSRTVNTYDGSRDFASSSLWLGLSGNVDQPGLRIMVRLNRSSAMGCPNVLDPPMPTGDERPSWLSEALKKNEAAEKARRKRILGPRPPKDPDLMQRVTVHRTALRVPPEGGKALPYGATVADVLREIAAQTGLPAIADFDPCHEDPFGRQWFKDFRKDLVDVPLWEALDTVTEAWDLSWEEKDGWLRVRSPRAPWALAGVVDLSPACEPERLEAEHEKGNGGSPNP